MRYTEAVQFSNWVIAFSTWVFPFWTNWVFAKTPKKTVLAYTTWKRKMFCYVLRFRQELKIIGSVSRPELIRMGKGYLAKRAGNLTMASLCSPRRPHLKNKYNMLQFNVKFKGKRVVLVFETHTLILIRKLEKLAHRNFKS